LRDQLRISKQILFRGLGSLTDTQSALFPKLLCRILAPFLILYFIVIRNRPVLSKQCYGFLC